MGIYKLTVTRGYHYASCEIADNTDGQFLELIIQNLLKEVDGQHLHLPLRGKVSKEEQLAKAFHEAYERLAPEFDYSTRKASAKPWSVVPIKNKKLMVAVVKELLEEGIITANLEND